MPAIRFRRPPCSRGVTLIEIMIVIAIMMILMGLIMAVIGPIRKRAREHSTRLLIDGIASSMSRYHMEYDDYPFDTVNPAKPDGTVTPVRGSVDWAANDFSDDGTLYVQMNGPDGLGSLKSTGTPYEKRLEPYLKVQPENLRKVGTQMILMDFFNHPIKYCNSEIFIRSGGDPKKVHNPKIDLWSLGENTTKSDDDIHNWQ